MKPLPLVLCFLLGSVLTLLPCMAVGSAGKSTREVQLLSDVHHPLGQCLDDIARAHDRGAKLAERKTRLLRQRWAEFQNGGRAPEQFELEILRMDDPSTRPTSRTNG